MTRRILGANDRVRLGFIGLGNRGSQLLKAFAPHEDAEVAALCDVYEPYVARDRSRVEPEWVETLGRSVPAMNEEFGPDVARYGDFRRVLDRDDIDAVVIATPDHWHAIQTISACDAGKDVYVEKPLSITIHEGRRMVEAARRNKSVVTVGVHRRSAPLYMEVADFVAGGNLGHVTVCHSAHRSNHFPNGVGRQKPTDPPAGFDWDLWLGPREYQPFQMNLAHYKFRWWSKYSSQTSNNGVHFFDCLRWITGEVAPTSICAMGGNFVVPDDRTIPDTLHVTFQFDSGRIFNFYMLESSGNRIFNREGYFEIRGTQGTLYAGDSKYEVVPERGGQFQDSAERMKPVEVAKSAANASATTMHARNFLDCIKSREKPNADVEEGHRSTSMSLLAKISLTVGQRLAWDPVAERVTNCPEANDLLHYEYREPWKLG